MGVYRINNAYMPPLLTWVWHPYHLTLGGIAYKAMKAHTWVEVMHEADPFGDESFGAWFLYTPGSGIYMNTGRTRVFRDHEAAYAFFGIGSWRACQQSYQECMSVAAANRGDDSVQFTAHVDHVNYPCDTDNTGNAGLEFMGLEIVAVKGKGVDACGDIDLRAGWKASRTCSCSNAHSYTNCKGVPTSELETETTYDAVSSPLPNVHKDWVVV